MNEKCHKITLVIIIIVSDQHYFVSFKRFIKFQQIVFPINSRITTFKIFP